MFYNEFYRFKCILYGFVVMLIDCYRKLESIKLNLEF